MAREKSALKEAEIFARKLQDTWKLSQEIMRGRQEKNSSTIEQASSRA